MNGKIALEEHFAINDTIEDSRVYARPEMWEGLRAKLLDFETERLDQMDEHGVEYAILSLNSPAVQAIFDVPRAIEVARKANDLLAEQIARHPKRFGGFAALPMQDPDAAARELERCVQQLGFHGFLVNGFCQVGSEDRVAYYDGDQYRDFWSVAAALKKPFYMHPRDPLASREPIYDGNPWLCGPTWAFAVETSIHALRLMGSGLFDRHPELQMVLGHLGEGIPFNVWRIDHILRKGRRGMAAEKEIGEYLRSNVHLTTSGNFRAPTLLSSMLEMGSDRIMFSVDYPFEKHADAASWFDTVHISENDRRKIGRDNAIKLFDLKL
ncbi:amidohydrolase family protein [Pseudoduganella namucuonensis]|uniref:2,3-dihydroxybenzoate decarboxylase n=1 Tax=Pseudoduganella namucuonensis TaxID=1035707 RepID=A0A1I7LHM2_9BURK|nr:amidohydrolase family protein [Pseudoduganella namucuonensis]SFV09182.1 2,3-dihydroxybenzoate decarboxylase [Pseudoduganella namucuonensis]